MPEKVHPTRDESEEAFISRCMTSLADEYSDRAQRYAVCQRYWDAGPKAADGLRYAACTSDLKAVNTERREVVHAISTATEDRVGDIIEPAGWELDNYRRNPVVLLDHQRTVDHIIGRGTVWTERDGLYARTSFGDHQLGRDAFALVRAGLASAWSVGFRGVDFSPRKTGKTAVGGVHFKRQELYEYSLVAVPMNPDAVTHALKSCGVSQASLRLLAKLDPEPAAPPADAARSGATAEARVLSEGALLALRNALERSERSTRRLILDVSLREVQHGR